MAREGFISADLRLQGSETLVAIVAREGYDRQPGVRPLQRAIERMVVTPLARWKVAHPKVQNSLLEIDFAEKSKLVVRVIARPEELE
jgi:ATP-dependent Clp protease ATP-binding subunit ClpC